MDLAVSRHAERLRAALAGATAAEAAAGAAAGARQLLDLAGALAATGGRVDDERLAAGMAEPPAGGLGALLQRGALAGLLTPLDRPRLRRAAHRLATLGGADEGTAMTAVAAAVLAADLCRFDLENAVVRLRQTLLEEAPAALHLRLRPLRAGEPVYASGDPGDALQVALTALDRAADLPSVVAEAAGYEGAAGPACVLAGILAGARSGFDGCDDAWLETVPAGERVAAAAEGLARVAESTPPASPGLVSPSLAARLAAAGGTTGVPAQGRAPVSRRDRDATGPEADQG